MSVFFVAVGPAQAVSSVSGTPEVNQPLTVTPDTAGDEIDWYDCDSAGTQSTELQAGVSDTYTTQETDVGDYICADEPATTTASAPFGPITDPSETPPIIGGTWQQGDALSVSQDATWTDPPSPIDDQWVDCAAGGTGCTAIPGATGSSYTLRASDVGEDVEVQETPVYGGQPATGATQQSAANDDVVIAAPGDVAAPSVSGTPELGQTLTAQLGSWTNTPTSFSTQWLRCVLTCDPIAGADGLTYRLGDTDVGSTISVEVTAGNEGGMTSVSSSPTTMVLAPTTVSLSTSLINPRVNQRITLFGFITSSADTVNPAGTLTFSDGGTAISGCTGLPVTAGGQGVTVSCTTSFAVSQPALQAKFTPAAGTPLAGSASTTQAIAVRQDATTTTLDVPSQVRAGSSVTYTASITAARNLTGPVVPGGRVAFLDHGHGIAGCRSVLANDGGATCTVRYSRPGSHVISARYDGDANFTGSKSPRRTVDAVSGGSAPASRLVGAITATMQWTFHFTPRYTSILALALHGAHAGSRITVHCTGRGCPFHSHVRRVGKARRCHRRGGHACPAPGSIDLEPSFRHHRLRVHARVIVTITRTRWVGKYYRFTVRARREPKILISCLAPHSDQPGVGCSH